MNLPGLFHSPEILYHRHQLSYTQIDALKGTDNHSFCSKDIMNSLLIERELLVMIDLFQKNQIRFLPLKGPVLSYRIYKDPTVRRCHDIDFLIDFDQILPLNDLILSKGYKAVQQLKSDKKFLKSLYYNSKDIKYFHPIRKIVIELHWRLFTYDVFGKEDTYSVLENHTVNFDFMNRQIKVLNSEFDLLYITLHGAIHKWSILKWLFDTNDYLRFVMFDENEFLILVDRFKCRRVLSLYNQIAERYIPDPALFHMNIPVPSVLKRNCINDIENRKKNSTGFSEKAGKSLKKLRYQFFLIPGFKRRLFFVSKYLKRDLLSGLFSGFHLKNAKQHDE
jgi:hypothetical protein